MTFKADVTNRDDVYAAFAQEHTKPWAAKIGSGALKNRLISSMPS